MNPNHKSLLFGILAGIMISLLLFGGGTYVYGSLSSRTLKVPANVLTKITIGNTELSYLYTPDSGLLRTNIVFANVNDTFSVKVYEGYCHSWGGWVSNLKKVSPDYIVLFFEPINLKPVNENWW
jgi:hypothetical protein